MGRVLAVANQKGGVAKTTTVHSLGSALAELGQRVLLVDLDPQACLTFSAGLDPEKLPASLHDVLVRRTAITDVIESIRHNLDIAPATIDLAGSEVILLTRTGREHVLARALASVRDDYDTILIDCPPSLGVLTINGLSAADSVLIPLQCEALSHRGVGQLLETVADVRAFANDRLEVLGVIATMFDGRTRHGREILTSVGEHYSLRVIEPPVPKSVRFAESAGQGQSILSHSPSSPGADAYRAIAAQLDAEIRPGVARPTLEESSAAAP
ncbi:MAG TPA: ParA family protein [Acidimicrobiales bacterium]|nr:ParA family protein [Acidimicrobiales bacterium]